MPERKKFHGRKPHTPGRAHVDGQMCKLGHVMYHHKRDAIKASPVNDAERCGRCRQWKPIEGKGYDGAGAPTVKAERPKPPPSPGSRKSRHRRRAG